MLGDKRLLPAKKAIITLASVMPSNHYHECMGISKRHDKIYFSANGKALYAVDITHPQATCITTIAEVTRPWNDEYGDTFLHDLKCANDGMIYAAAEDRILMIDPVSGRYETPVKDGFSGAWGSYGLALDDAGNILVGDHDGGVFFYQKSRNWKKHVLLQPSMTSMGQLASFGGVELAEGGNVLYALDFKNSLLYSGSVTWDAEGVPTLTAVKSLRLPLVYPEFMQIWNGDVFIKAARDNSMVRVRNHEVIQEISFESDETVSPIVTFVLDPQDLDRAVFYGTSWGPDGTLFRGELAFR